MAMENTYYYVTYLAQIEVACKVLASNEAEAKKIIMEDGKFEIEESSELGKRQITSVDED